MLTEDEQEHLFNVFKNAFYNDDKSAIEENLNKIEDQKTRKERDELLNTAEKNASKLASRVIKKIKHMSMKEISDTINSQEQDSFGKGLLNEVNDELGSLK